MVDIKYTDEQREIFDKARSGWSFVVEAGAGTGKTSTLAEAARIMPIPPSSILYLAYNKAIVKDSKKSFPAEVLCSTAHGLAYRALGHLYSTMLQQGAVQGWQIAKAIGVKRWQEGSSKLSGPSLASLARRTVKAWARSVDPEIMPHHVPVPDSIVNPEDRASAREAAVGYAKKLWNIARRPDQRMLRFDHDWYLKLFSASGPGDGVPQLGMRVIMFDECQDADPVIRLIFEGQADCQRVAVGDSQQAIYAWRGAEDAIKRFREAGAPMFPLTTSWRFGREVADEANRWLDQLDGDIRITGNPAIESRLDRVDPSRRHAILCRTNSGALSTAVYALEAGSKVAIAGCDKEVRALVLACERLYKGQDVDHPELMGFGSWTDLAEFAKSKDCDNATLRTLVRLSEEYSPPELRMVISTCVEEGEAQVVTSTAHKAKGRQWEQVSIGADFGGGASKVKGGDAMADLRLSYVAVTRARKTLDLGPLANR